MPSSESLKCAKAPSRTRDLQRGVVRSAGCQRVEQSHHNLSDNLVHSDAARGHLMPNVAARSSK